MARAIAFSDLNTLVMEKRMRELIDLEQQAIRERRINEAFEFYRDRVQLKKMLAFPVSSIGEETITHFYKQSCNVKLEKRPKSNTIESPMPLPEGMTNVCYSPSGKQWIGWQSKPALNLETCQFSDENCVTYWSNESGKITRLELPFNILQQIVWTNSETQIALLGRPGDSTKLVLLHLSTSSKIIIDDFGESVPLCLLRLFFSLDDQSMFVETCCGQAIIYETKEGKRIGGPFFFNGDYHGNPWNVSLNGCVFFATIGSICFT